MQESVFGKVRVLVKDQIEWRKKNGGSEIGVCPSEN
jgi:hypothetical protein